MKQFVFVALILGSLVTKGVAQVKKGLETVTINTPTVQCQMCKDRIEEYLKAEDGVQKVAVDYKHKKTKVTFFTERTNAENIKTAIANVGYDADDITANEDSYKNLPKCCKKPEDGGGMPTK